MTGEAGKKKATSFARGNLVQLKSGGPKMVVRESSKGQVTCRWFSGETLKEKIFYFEELSVADQDLVERLNRARQRVAAHNAEKEVKYDLARRIVFLVEKAKRDGATLPKAITDLVEKVQKK